MPDREKPLAVGESLTFSIDVPAPPGSYDVSAVYLKWIPANVASVRRLDGDRVEITGAAPGTLELRNGRTYKIRRRLTPDGEPVEQCLPVEDARVFKIYDPAEIYS
jgi:hypothetical protein